MSQFREGDRVRLVGVDRYGAVVSANPMGNDYASVFVFVVLDGQSQRLMFNTSRLRLLTAIEKLGEIAGEPK